jgi:uncharacterized protein YdhG (YjbR/CyaY superfamily)
MKDEIQLYIDKQAPLQKEILEKLRKPIKKSAPLATEAMSYGVPAFKFKGNLVLYAAFKNHIGIYPEPKTIQVFKNELKNYDTSKGTIKFALDKQIPYDLIEKIVKYKYKNLKSSK